MTKIIGVMYIREIHSGTTLVIVWAEGKTITHNGGITMRGQETLEASTAAHSSRQHKYMHTSSAARVYSGGPLLRASGNSITISYTELYKYWICVKEGSVLCQLKT